MDKNIKISDVILIENGFVEDIRFQDAYLKTIGVRYFNKNLENNVINLTYGLSNMEGRDWTIQIDDKDCCGIAAVDIDTVEHFNKVCELMEINFSI